MPKVTAAQMEGDVELQGWANSWQEDALMAQLLPFEQQMVEELLAEDGLCVMAVGLSWQRIAAVLLLLQFARCREPGQGGAMLVLGASEAQRMLLKAELARVQSRRVSCCRSPPSLSFCLCSSFCLTQSVAVPCIQYCPLQWTGVNSGAV